MKDRIEFAIVVRTDELSGKTVKVLGPVIKAVTKKIEPQLLRIVEAITKAVEKEFDPKDDTKHES
ncbi:MAG: hypothetical protein PHF05_06090 [Candidatus Izemoplasmatales bacterium]|nr:hypothetical protein [Candidatus Izemoplasmatales bacterium]